MCTCKYKPIGIWALIFHFQIGSFQTGSFQSESSKRGVFKQGVSKQGVSEQGVSKQDNFIRPICHIFSLIQKINSLQSLYCIRNEFDANFKVQNMVKWALETSLFVDKTVSSFTNGS